MNAPSTYFFCPAGPARSVVSSNPATCAAVISVRDQLDHVRGQLGGLAQAGVDEPGGDLRAGDVADQLAAPLDRHVLEHQQVDGQGPQVRADRDRRVRHARRAGRHVLAARSRTPSQCRSCWIRCADGSGISSCWNDRATPRSAAPARSAPHSHAPCRVVVAGVVRLGPAHRRSRRAGLLAPLALLRLPASAARRCLRGGLRPGASSPDGGIEELPLLRDDDPLQPGHLLAELTDLLLQGRRVRPQVPPSSARSSAISSSRAAQPAQPGAGGGISDTSHDHAEPALSKQDDTQSRPAKPSPTRRKQPRSESNRQTRQGA